MTRRVIDTPSVPSKIGMAQIAASLQAPSFVTLLTKMGGNSPSSTSHKARSTSLSVSSALLSLTEYPRNRSAI